MWMVMKVTFWKGLKLEGGLPFFPELAEPDDGSLGFCDVYEDYEKALERAGDPNIIQEVAYKGEK